MKRVSFQRSDRPYTDRLKQPYTLLTLCDAASGHDAPFEGVRVSGRHCG